MTSALHWFTTVLYYQHQVIICVWPSSDIDIMDNSAAIKKTIADNKRKFHRACNQIVLLNNHLDNLQLRYDCAYRDNSLRIKLSTLEGVRNMYVEYEITVLTIDNG